MHVFVRKLNYRELEFQGELNIKEFSRQDIKREDFKEVIISEESLIYNSKIFYLYKEEPHDDGILEAKEL